MRTPIRLAGIAAVSLLALGIAGCKGKAPEPAASESAAPDMAAASQAASGAPEVMGPSAPAGVEVSEATVKLPAVAGRPGAAYFTVAAGAEALKIAAVHVDGVGHTELHETVMEGGISKMQPASDVPVVPGKPTVFKPGGLHVMLYDVGAGLKAGGTTVLTVTFDNGDKASAPARIINAADMPGGGMGHM